jgi:hypothetical protein
VVKVSTVKAVAAVTDHRDRRGKARAVPEPRAAASSAEEARNGAQMRVQVPASRRSPRRPGYSRMNCGPRQTCALVLVFRLKLPGIRDVVNRRAASTSPEAYSEVNRRQI